MASKAMRWTGRIVAGLAAVILLAIAAIYFLSERAVAEGPNPRAERLVRPATLDLVEAERRTRTLGCLGCHREGLTGGPFMEEPKVAVVHAPNLTTLAASASDQQLAQAIRQGIGADGRMLYIMPSESYQFLTDAETAAVIAYIRSLPKKGEQSPERKIGPLGRIGILAGQFDNAPKLAAAYRAKPPADLGPTHALGRHLAMTTCSGCHGSDLGGRQVSPEMNAPSLDIAGAYDLAAFAALLREGKAPPGRVINEMKRVAKDDSRHYTDSEIAALHAYLVDRARR